MSRGRDRVRGVTIARLVETRRRRRDHAAAALTLAVGGRAARARGGGSAQTSFVLRGRGVDERLGGRDLWGGDEGRCRERLKKRVMGINCCC